MRKHRWPIASATLLLTILWVTSAWFELHVQFAPPKSSIVCVRLTEGCITIQHISVGENGVINASEFPQGIHIERIPAPNLRGFGFQAMVGYTFIGIPLWLFLLVSSWLTYASFRNPILPHQCRKCRYDLTGVTDRCPECATSIPPMKKPADPKAGGP